MKKGVSLIVLIITIIVMIILASAVIITFSNNNIIQQAQNASESTREAYEKNIISMAAAAAASKSETGEVTISALREALIEFASGQTIKVLDNGESIAINFGNSEVYYNINQKGEIESFIPYFDTTPGELVVNANGEYMIESIEDLVVLSAITNGGYSDDNLNIRSHKDLEMINVILMCDLDFKSPLSYGDSTTKKYNGYLGVEDNATLIEALTNIKKYKGYIPMIKTERRVTINFEGKNHFIKNLCENADDYAGLIGIASREVTIKDLTVTGEISGVTYAGGIIGQGIGKIINCTNYAKVTADSAGGICGYLTKGTINNSTNFGQIFATDSGGGIVGYNYNSGSIEVNYCVNNGYVSGMTAGGIMGAKGSQSVVFNSCLNTADAIIISTSSNGYAGGIVGRKHNLLNFYFYNCINLGAVSGYYSGGIFGNVAHWDSDIIANCFAGGNITGTYVGGIGGRAPGGDTAYNSYYLKSESVNYSVGDPAEDKIAAQGITKITQTEINTLNNYIDNNTDEIDTTGWKKWTLDANGNPTFLK